MSRKAKPPRIDPNEVADQLKDYERSLVIYTLLCSISLLIFLAAFDPSHTLLERTAYAGVGLGGMAGMVGLIATLRGSRKWSKALYFAFFAFPVGTVTLGYLLGIRKGYFDLLDQQKKAEQTKPTR